jgi:uridine kinase
MMISSNALPDPKTFSEKLFEIMKVVSACQRHLELYEFRFCLKEWEPDTGWGSLKMDGMVEMEACLGDRAYYERIQVTPRVEGDIVMDNEITRLTRMLFVGLVTGAYPVDWVKSHFYFDGRGFYFLPRSIYFTDDIRAHFGGKPYRAFEQKQKLFEDHFEISYQEFKEANREVDELFISSVIKLIAARGTPIVLAIAGATAAGKTEIVERLSEAFAQSGRQVTSMELDNFLTDRDYREAQGINSQGKAAIHLDLLRQCLEDLTQGKKVYTPHYDTVVATSSHDLQGQLKTGRNPIPIEPADIIFIEGNFPFQIEEIQHLIGIKVVYLTDDPVRMKRKWRRDMDFRKKFNLNYFRNRYFREQFIMAEVAYRPQMEICDMLVDTTGAALWITPGVAKILDGSER